MEKIIKLELSEQQVAVIWAAVNTAAWRGDTVEIVAEVKRILEPYAPKPAAQGGKQ